ncbi:MAG: trypsin-like peptidase domain-containing protein, partial [Chloroflexota bacterium]
MAANRAPGVSVLYPDVRYQPESPPILYVYTVGSATDRAKPAYQAEVVAVDGYLDLAVLRIVADADGARVDPEDLDLTAVPIGTAKDLRPLDDLVVTGYPDIADTYAARFTKGALNNFADDRRVGRDAWLHTDAKIASGNSGGLAVDQAGRLVAVPTQTTSDGPNGAIDYNMRPIDLALPLIEAARAGKPYDAYTNVTRPTGDESATILGWSDVPADSCASGGEVIPFGTSVVYPRIQFDGMQRGDHVLVELVDLAAPAADGVVGYSSFDWPDDFRRSECVPVPLQLDRSFPQGDFGPFLEGEFGVSVRVGPVDELKLSTGTRATAMRVIDPPGTPSDPGGAVTRPDETSSNVAGRSGRERRSRRDVEAALTRRAGRLGFYGCKPFRQSGANDPSDYGATGAIRCVKPADKVSQFAFFRFSGASGM